MLPALELRRFVASGYIGDVSGQPRSGGRPRKWDNEAARKRAYRQRRAAELSEPLALREEARSARSAASAALAALEMARSETQKWRARAAAAEKRADGAEHRAATVRTKLSRAIAERDEARRLLRRKLQWAKHAEGLRNDPDALLALVSELYAEQQKLKATIAGLQRQMQRTATPAWPHFS